MAVFFPGLDNEKVLSRFLDDFTPFNKDTVLIGGWLPWVYARFYWKLRENIPIIKTFDIDIAVNETDNTFEKTIAAYLEELNGYEKKPVYEGEEDLFSFSLKDENSIYYPLDFMSHEFMDPQHIERITGQGLSVIPLETVDIMLNMENWINISFLHNKKTVSFNALHPAVYSFIKGVTFADRFDAEDQYKAKKDLWALYFILEYIPLRNFDDFFTRLKAFMQNEYSEIFLSNLKEYFKDKDSDGAAAVAEILTGYMPADIIKERAFLKINNLLNKLME